MAVPGDQPCLRFPENIAPQPHLTHENAAAMLLRALQASTQMPFQWGWIDRPHDGSIYLIFLIAQHGFPQDGIRYQEQEQRYTIPFPGGREMEVCETRYGYVPNSGETVASRVRRRYRILKGGHLQLCLIHYSRGQAMPIAPGAQNQPVRMYPLRQITEPAVFVMGEKVGQKVAPHRDPQTLLANQNREMQELERRAQRDRNTTMNQRPPAQPQAQTQQTQRMDEEDDMEDLEHISTRTLALTRYRRNHEFMSEVFMHAAFGEKNAIKSSSPYSIFSKDELDEKAAKLVAEVEELKAKAAARKAAREEAERADVSMGVDLDVTIDVQIVG